MLADCRPAFTLWRRRKACDVFVVRCEGGELEEAHLDVLDVLEEAVAGSEAFVMLLDFTQGIAGVERHLLRLVPFALRQRCLHGTRQRFSLVVCPDAGVRRWAEGLFSLLPQDVPTRFLASAEEAWGLLS